MAVAVTQWFAPLEVSSACLADPERLLPRFAAEHDEIERAWLADPPETTDAFAEADHLLERWTQDVGRPRPATPAQSGFGATGT